MPRAILILLTICLMQPAWAGALRQSFASIDGGTIDLSNWAGRPILVVNTASECGFSDQYRDLQMLYDRFRDQGLIVLAVPSDDFRQELDSAQEVKDYCELVFGIDLPMADISRVTGANAHPFFLQVRAETGFSPRWNFNKILIGRDGSVLQTWRARSNPMGQDILSAVEDELARN